VASYSRWEWDYRLLSKLSRFHLLRGETFSETQTLPAIVPLCQGPLSLDNAVSSRIAETYTPISTVVHINR
jgi:hypothetical protein